MVLNYDVFLRDDYMCAYDSCYNFYNRSVRKIHFIINVPFYNALLLIRSNSTADFPVAATTGRTSTNSRAPNDVVDIKVSEDLDVHSNIVGFGPFLENTLRSKVLKYTLKPLTKKGENWAAILQAIEVKLVHSNDSNHVSQLKSEKEIAELNTICTQSVHHTFIIFLKHRS